MIAFFAPGWLKSSGKKCFCFGSENPSVKTMFLNGAAFMAELLGKYPHPVSCAM